MGLASFIFALLFPPASQFKNWIFLASVMERPQVVDFHVGVGYFTRMSSSTKEIIQICEALPADKQSELADIARFLLARQDDEAWERLINYPEARPRLDAFLRDSAAEADEPLDPKCW